jgi:hypothetical protein
VIKADIGGFVGHSESHPDILVEAGNCLAKVKKAGMLVDYCITKCGDDVQLIMTHELGVDNEKIHRLAWATYVSCTKVAKIIKTLRRLTGFTGRCFFRERDRNGARCGGNGIRGARGGAGSYFYGRQDLLRFVEYASL